MTLYNVVKDMHFPEDFLYLTGFRSDSADHWQQCILVKTSIPEQEGAYNVISALAGMV